MTPAAEPEARPGRREAAKEERRQRIIEAARDLIRETGSTGLSMRELAKRAGVSLATPYNLFGSKSAVVLGVLHDARDYRVRFAQIEAGDPLDRMLSALDLAIGYYLADPDFYRILWREVFSASGEVRHAIYNPKRDDFWLGLLAALEQAGAIQADIRLPVLLHQLDHQFRSIMLDWVVGELPAPALAASIRLGYALILGGAAPPAWRERLASEVARAQAMLCDTDSGGSGRSVMPS